VCPAVKITLKNGIICQYFDYQTTLKRRFFDKWSGKNANLRNMKCHSLKKVDGKIHFRNLGDIV